MFSFNNRSLLFMSIFLLLNSFAYAAGLDHPGMYSRNGKFTRAESELHVQAEPYKKAQRALRGSSWKEFIDSLTNSKEDTLLKDYNTRLFNSYSKERTIIDAYFPIPKWHIEKDPASIPLTLGEIESLFNAYDAWVDKQADPKPKKLEYATITTKSDKVMEEYEEARKKQVLELIKNDNELNNFKGHLQWGIPAGLLLIGGFFACKEGFKYWKETAMNPPFIDDTNDVNLFNEIYDWFTGKSKKGFNPTDKNLSWNDDKLEEMKLLKKKYKDAINNNTPTPHYLFFGPHGTGKTHFARELATKISSTYYIISASAFLEEKGSENFRQLMNYIRSSNSRPIIVIDEADNLLKHSTDLASNERRVFNQILEATGDTDNHIATFIFCTNLPDSIDERMKSRLTMVEFANPDLKTREKIIINDLEYYFEKAVGGHSTIEYNQITPTAITEVAKITEGWSGRAIDKAFEDLRSFMWVKKNFDCTPELFINFFKEIIIKEKVLRDNQTKLQDFYKSKAHASHK